ncbi:MAG: nucleotide-binding protein [Parcubacteria group bacterium]|nr:nucleotide-binding protein [Parcubacteria group bacterium]
MARRSKAKEEVEIPSSIEPKAGILLLKKQKEKLNEMLTKESIDTAEHTAWKNTTKDYLKKIFGSKSDNISAVIHASSSESLQIGMGDYQWNKYMISLIQNQLKLLDSCIEQLETQIELLGGEVGTKKEEKTEIGNKVFIVHGHNNEIKESVARLIETLGLLPIILHEQPNKGRTLIEKFTDYADVGFAIILLTSDDLGEAKAKKTSLLPRARQNVVLELGYFLAKLGRDKVCPLFEQGVELPSDYEGIVYIPLDPSGKWKFDVVKELKAVGFNIDANKVF